MAAKKTTGAETFETRMARLEELTRTLEGGGVPLAEALTLYEEGAKLVQALEKELTAAQQRLTILRQNAEGQDEEEPLTED